MNHLDLSRFSSQSSLYVRRFLLTSAAALGMICASSGVQAMEFGMHAGPGMHGQHQTGDVSRHEKHLERMLDRMVPDISTAQKDRIKEIMKAAHTERAAMHEQLLALRKAKIQILTAATIDRNALEQNRLEADRFHDQASRARNQALANAAEVLTPAQRAKVGEALNARMDKLAKGQHRKSPFGQ